ncbi:hypothetical protein [Paracoccus mutanolyticus]|uniref:hypothetical protein n=1 Tax=Paracoccus mutanolyticus TaxID=1499308 RepID=UPI0011AEBE15|nr:hypothetical protein [Paracoccus mutanolyticus]
MGSDFDGVIIVEVVDENMANAARVHAVENGKNISDNIMIALGRRGQHGHAAAGVVYVSGTGATASGCANATAPWSRRRRCIPCGSRPGRRRARAGGVAAMEVLARDLRALRSNACCHSKAEWMQTGNRSMAIPVWHSVRKIPISGTPIMRNNLEAAKQAANITGGEGGSGTLIRQDPLPAADYADRQAALFRPTAHVDEPRR